MMMFDLSIMMRYLLKPKTATDMKRMTDMASPE